MKFLLALLLLVVSSQAFGKFAPDNDLWIGPDMKGGSAVDEISFNQIIDDLETKYAPVIEKRGAWLNVLRKWEDGTVNAYAVQYGDEWQVAMFGGLARHEMMTPDGFAMVLCHELGHHIGGAPKYTTWYNPSPQWASAEGQSDYFAGAKCMKRYFEDKDNWKAISKWDIPAVVSEKCEQVYGFSYDYPICIRVAMAGKALGNTLASLNSGKLPKFDTPSTSVVSKTNTTGYPSVQCRLDTYFQGGLCDIDPTIDTSETDASVGYCNLFDGYGIGTRPACWYKE